MISVLVANTKGGCGKTTIATTLASAFAGQGRFTVLADVDRQHSSLDWAKRRPDVAPALAGLDWAKSEFAVPKDAERVVIDAPAALKMKDVEALVKMADVIVLPVLPSAFDEAATRRFLNRLEELKPIRKSRAAVAIVGNRMRVRTRAAAQLDAFLGGLGHSVVSRIRDSAAYTEAAAEGLSVFDLRGRRAEDLREDWTPLLRHIEEAGAA
ncbi:ParA family protein [Inquilinus limosus]|uniref:nucleotide-binding protein n=1 Tax=Inquilinus limosus TaxID=171674 RepID=UPI003F17A2C5